jgi:hypothetical protein
VLDADVLVVQRLGLAEAVLQALFSAWGKRQVTGRGGTRGLVAAGGVREPEDGSRC